MMPPTVVLKIANWPDGQLQSMIETMCTNQWNLGYELKTMTLVKGAMLLVFQLPVVN